MGHLYSHLVFRPPSVVSYQSVDGFIKYQVPDADGVPRVHKTHLIWLVNDLNVRIPCVWLRRPSAEYVILYAHQNGEDLGSSVCDAHMLSHGLNVDVFAFEYSGYGLSERPKRPTLHPFHCPDGHQVAPTLLERDRDRVEPSEKGCCSDIDAAYAYLTQHCHIDPTKVIIFGRSIGSGPAVYCASRKKVGGLVLIAPIASAVRVPLKKLNVTLPFIDTFPNIDRASKITCPVLVVHGDMDELVPKLHGEKLFHKINQNGVAVKPLWIPEAKHNNVVEDFHSIVFNRYLKFLDELKTMSLARKSLDTDSEPRLHYKHYHHDPHRIRSRSMGRTLASWLTTSRISVDGFSTCAQEGGDDDRRSRDIRERGVNDSFHNIISFTENIQHFQPHRTHKKHHSHRFLKFQTRG